MSIRVVLNIFFRFNTGAIWGFVWLTRKWLTLNIWFNTSIGKSFSKVPSLQRRSILLPDTVSNLYRGLSRHVSDDTTAFKAGMADSDTQSASSICQPRHQYNISQHSLILICWKFEVRENMMSAAQAEMQHLIPDNLTLPACQQLLRHEQGRKGTRTGNSAPD